MAIKTRTLSPYFVAFGILLLLVLEPCACAKSPRPSQPHRALADICRVFVSILDGDGVDDFAGAEQSEKLSLGLREGRQTWVYLSAELFEWYFLVAKETSSRNACELGLLGILLFGRSWEVERCSDFGVVADAVHVAEVVLIEALVAVGAWSLVMLAV